MFNTNKKIKIFLVIILLTIVIFLVFLAIDPSFFKEPPDFLIMESSELNNAGTPKHLSLNGEIVKNPVILLGEKLINVEIAQTNEERTMGLSGRMSLGEDSGLLFIFERPDIYGFWMKDMNFPIDIIWISENLEVVHLEKSVSPEIFPKVFKPSTPSLYVLEINAGIAEENNIEVGSKVEILKNK